MKSSLGKITLLVFWASWCGPCKAENPINVQIYNEFHAKGLNIIGVSLDRDVASWKSAIKNDGLNWTQISNLKGWQDPIAKLYGVEQIPFTVLINKEELVIAIDIHGESLRRKLKILL